ncbi:MAG: hypothetical protein JWP37_1113 [Mucilaginibacter sp.]|nr:hypothetical protein [Mucilaginibacter sp.]
MRKVFFATALFTMCFSIRSYSQDNGVLQNIISKLKPLSAEHIIEKAYLHFDKPYYAVGDTMYFKAYLTLGERHNLSKASGIMYVDLINPANAVSNSIKLQIIDGVGWGDFVLADSLQKGNYRVRAYTKYMQNDADYFFDQNIPVGSIGSTHASAGSTVTAQAAKADIQFFPEGGELVSGLISKVAFKSIGANGLGVNVKGVITDNANIEVSKFSSSHLGMGTFYFEPEEGKTYKAKVTYADGTQNTVDLPKALSKGIVLVITDSLNKMSVEIHCNKAYLQENLNKDVNLLLYSGGFVSSVNTKLDSRVLSMDVLNSKFATGIVQVTLFSQTGEPLSERLVFVQNPDLLNMAVTSDKTTYKKREKVQINVNAKNSGGAAPDGHFSVSVIDESKVPVDENTENTILTNLLLTTELKGYVEQPNYYFVSNAKNSKADLDALMLTQGYRRFSWKQLLNDNNSAPFAYQPERTLTITGSEKTSAGLPVAKKDILLRTSINNGLLSQQTDDKGNFKFDDMVFMDGTTFTLQASGSTKDKNSTLFSVNNENSGLPVNDKNIAGSQDDVNRRMIPYLDNEQEQQNELSGKNAAYVPAGGAAHADQVVSGDDIRNASSLVTALSGRLQGVDFIQGLPYLKGRSASDPMLIVVDGKIRGSFVDLNKITPGNVKSVELLKGNNADAYGTYGTAGVLVISTLQSSKTDMVQNDSYKYNSKKVIPLKNVVTKGVNSASYRSSNLGGAGHADQVILSSDLGNASSLSAGLNGRLLGVDFVHGVPYLRGGSTVTAMGQGISPMYVLVDGTPGTSDIDNINPNSVEAIEVLKGNNAAIYGEAGGSGVLVITTRRGSDHAVNESATSALGTLHFTPKGFYKARDFYSPKYDFSTPQSSRPDLRSTIFWRPELITDKEGNASFDYYNADGHGNYRVVIEGIDNAGNIGRQVYRYKVE